MNLFFFLLNRLLRVNLVAGLETFAMFTFQLSYRQEKKEDGIS